MEEKYQRYLQIPKFSRPSCPVYNIYDKKWHVLTGRAIVRPHPHRHYTFEEFVEACKNDEELNNL